ncbi:MAG: hypothetical protein QM733_04655 [Ilumatobacteraceae bacterium]
MSADRALRVGVVLSTADWWSRLNAYAADHGSNVEVVVVRDAQAVLQSGLQIVCADDSVLWFNRSMVVQAEAAGITVVGIRFSQDVSSDERLAAMGIGHRLNDSVAPAAMIDLLGRLRPFESFDEIVAGLEPPSPGGDGSRIVVGGPPGAGAREIAIGLAAEVGRASSTILVDCSESSPGVARRLGLRLQPHVLDAAKLGPGVALADVLGRPADGLESRALPFDVICGLPSPSDWQRLSPAMADDVLAACTASWRYRVATTSPTIEDLGRWVNRYAVSRYLLGSADVVVAVCEATPRGVVRFVDWLADAQTPSPVRVVVNKTPKSRFVVGEVVEQLRSLCGDHIDVVTTVPFDRRVAIAEWDASLPTRGAFTRAMRSAAGALVASPAVREEVGA